LGSRRKRWRRVRACRRCSNLARRVCQVLRLATAFDRQEHDYVFAGARDNSAGTSEGPARRPVTNHAWKLRRCFVHALCVREADSYSPTCPSNYYLEFLDRHQDSNHATSPIIETHSFLWAGAGSHSSYPTRVFSRGIMSAKFTNNSN